MASHASPCSVSQEITPQRTNPIFARPDTETVKGQSHHPSALRNRVPILKAMLKFLPDSDSWTGNALEIASGTAAHLEVLAPAYPELTWTPSEMVPKDYYPPEEQWWRYGKIGLRDGLDEIAHINDKLSVFANVKPAATVDLSLKWWAGLDSSDPYALVFVSNTLHVTPWDCSEGLFEGAAAVLEPGGHLVIYGPFTVGGEDVGAGSTRQFDAWLRNSNDAWGVRDVTQLSALASRRGLTLVERVDMPRDNHLLHFVKDGEGIVSRFVRIVSLL
mmetsp:Transcript_25046/g.75189  ORF Transcript_25046/g.75189 Transcript_25046/m.75189 type:complete len:274 (-) Transcript_25046:86-907(-)